MFNKNENNQNTKSSKFIELNVEGVSYDYLATCIHHLITAGSKAGDMLCLRTATVTLDENTVGRYVVNFWIRDYNYDKFVELLHYDGYVPEYVAEHRVRLFKI